jgi:hypothetical protein
MFADESRNFDSRHMREREVQDCNVGALLKGDLERPPAVIHIGNDLPTGTLLQHRTQTEPDGGMVVRYENSFHLPEVLRRTFSNLRINH